MFGLSIRSVMESRKLVVAAPDASVREAARLMKEARVGAVLVVSDGQLVGIFTEARRGQPRHGDGSRSAHDSTRRGDDAGTEDARPTSRSATRSS